MDVRDLSPLSGPLLDALLHRLAADERFVGLTLGGSGARGTLDEHSDLDLVVVCRDDSHPTLLGELPALAASLGPLLACFTGEHVGEPRLLIALYGPPLLHVDLKLVGERDLAHRVEDGLLLWDRDGATAAVRAASSAEWPQPDPQWIEDRFWVWVHYGATKIARGELFECLDLLALLRARVLAPLAAAAAGRPAQGVRRVERDDPALARRLEGTLGDHSVDGCVAALDAAVALYRELRLSWAPRIEQRSEAETEAVTFLRSIPRP